MNRHTILACGCSSAVLALTIVATSQDRFPDGPGRAELLKACSGCHEAENILAHPQTAGEWSGTLANMAQFGAEATEEEWRLIERYLDTELAMIRINQAAADELQRTVDVAETVAQAIVKYRQEHGSFTSTDDLKKVPGLEAAKVDARKDRLIF